MKRVMVIVAAVAISVIGLAACKSAPSAVSTEPQDMVISEYYSRIDTNPQWGYHHIAEGKAKWGEETFDDGSTAYYFEHVLQEASYFSIGSYEIWFIVPNTSLKNFNGISVDIAADNMELVEKVLDCCLFFNGDYEHVGYKAMDDFSAAVKGMSADPLAFSTFTYIFDDNDPVPEWSNVTKANHRINTIWVKLVTGDNKEDTDGRIYFRNFKFL